MDNNIILYQKIIMIIDNRSVASLSVGLLLELNSLLSRQIWWTRQSAGDRSLEDRLEHLPSW